VVTQVSPESKGTVGAFWGGDFASADFA